MRDRVKIYVASSWANVYFGDVVSTLRADGHDVYDFTDNRGFSLSGEDGWDAIDSVKDYLVALSHPGAIAEFRRNMAALRACDVCVYVMPCGISASLEAGWACGAGKRVVVYIPVLRDADLMINMAELVTSNFEDIRLHLCLPRTFKRSSS